MTGAGTSDLGGFELAQQPLHIVLIDRAFLAVFGEAVAAGAAGEEGALGGMGAGKGAPGDGVAIDIEIAAESLARFQFLRRSSPCRGHRVGAVVPGKGLAQPLIHADIQVFQHEDRRLQPLGQVEGQGARTRTIPWGLPGSSSTCLVSPWLA